MTHRIELKVNVELDHVTGKFATRDEMVEKLTEALEDAEPSDLDGLGEDGSTSYTVSYWEIEEIEKPTPKCRRR